MPQIVIRPPVLADAPDFHAMMTHPQVAVNLLMVPTARLAETEERLAKFTPNRHRFVAEINGRVVGQITLKQETHPRLSHTGAIGMAVHVDYWGQGIGTALMQKAVDLADNWLNLCRVELDVFTDNAAAIHLYEKFGFEIEATKRKEAFGYGRYRDIYHMARLRNPEPATPAQYPPPNPRPGVSLADITFRPPVLEDAASLHAFSIDPLVGQFTLRLPSRELEESKSRLQNPPPGLHGLHAVYQQEVVGWVYLFHDQKPRQMHTGSVAIAVHPRFWGLGVGTRLMEMILDVADNWLNLKRVELDVNTDNLPAVRLYEKLGFEVEGTRRMHVYGNGRWADSHIMSRIKA